MLRKAWLVLFLVFQQPDDNRIMANLLRQIDSMGEQIIKLNQQVMDLTKQNDELKKKCGDPCKGP